MNVLYVYSDEKREWNAAEWRCQIPHDAINKEGTHSAKMVNLTDCISGKHHEDIEWSDIMVIQRNLFGGVLGFVYRWRVYGKIVVMDLDDAYNLMPANVLSSPFWRDGTGKEGDKPVKLSFNPCDHLVYASRIVNAVTVPSEVLADDWRKQAPTYVVPNYPRMEPFIVNEPLLNETRPVVGWGGSYSHIDSFLNSGIVAALRRVQEKHNARIILAGGDERLLNALKIKGSEMLPWHKYKDWPKVLKSFTVGIAPLAGGYDRRRSDIKVLDYMICKIPWVASDDSPYHHLRPYGSLVRNQARYWEEAIEEAILHPDQDKLQAGYEYALTRDIDLNVGNIIATYQKIIDERRELI